MTLSLTFFKYVIPSLLSFALSGVYAIVDGYFVGNGIGNDGLAAINIAYPLVALIAAIGTGIGMAGSIHYSIYEGAKRYNERNRYFWVAMGLLLIAGSCLMLFLLTCGHQMLIMFKASDQILILADEYIRYIAYGALFQTFAVGMVPFIRNMGDAFIAMIAMISGFFTNIFIDYYLVWVIPLGMKGAALATVAGQIVTFIISFLYLLPKAKHLHCDWQEGWQYVIGSTLKVAISPFGLTFAPNVTLILINYFAFENGGNFYITCYAIISYIACVIALLLQGISDGSQPLISLFHGQKEKNKVQHILKLTVIFSLLVAVISSVIIFIYRKEISLLFGSSTEVAQTIDQIMIIFLIGFGGIAVSRSITSYFYAMRVNQYAYLLIYGESIVLLLLLMILPKVCGINGVWYSIPLSQMLTAAVSIILYGKTKRLN